MNKSYRLRLIFHRCPNNNFPDADIASDIKYIIFGLYLVNLDGFLYIRGGASVFSLPVTRNSK